MWASGHWRRVIVVVVTGDGEEGGNGLGDRFGMGDVFYSESEVVALFSYCAFVFGANFQKLLISLFLLIRNQLVRHYGRRFLLF